MSDQRLRELERAAAEGDLRARAELYRERVRSGQVTAETVPAWKVVVDRIGPDAACAVAECTPEQHAALVRDLAGLAEVDPTWPGRAEGFVLWGEDDGLLTAMAAKSALVRDGLRLGSSTRLRGGPAPRTVFRPGLPGAFLARLAVLYGSCLPYEERPVSFAAEVPSWLFTLLYESSDAQRRVWSGRQTCALAAADLEQAAVFAGLASDLPLRLAFDQTSGFPAAIPEVVAGTRGLVECLARYPTVAQAALGDPRAECRVRALKVLASGVQRVEELLPFAAELVVATSAGSAAVRKEATPLVRQLGALALPALRAAVETGKAQERRHAALLLAELGDEGDAARLVELAEGDRSPKVRAAIARALEERARSVPAPQPEAQLDPVGSLSVAARSELRAMTAAVSDEAFEAGLADVVSPEAWAAPPAPRWRQKTPERNARRRFAASPEVGFAHVVRVLWHSGEIEGWETEDRGRWGFNVLCRSLRDNAEARGVEPDLLDACLALRQAALDPIAIGTLAFTPRATDRPFSPRNGWCGWQAYLERYPDGALASLADMGAAVGSWRSGLRAQLDAVLGELDPIPGPIFEALLPVALGKAKGDRQVLQPHLGRQPGIEARLVEALGAKKQDTRLAAVQWLAARGDAKVRPALQEALDREKRPKVRAALQAALQQLAAKE